MKKTLVSMMLAVSCAMGVSLDTLTYTEGNVAIRADSGAFSYVLTLDCQALRQILEAGQPASGTVGIVTHDAAGNATGIMVQAQMVPEPATSALSLLALAGLAARWRRK